MQREVLLAGHQSFSVQERLQRSKNALPKRAAISGAPAMRTALFSNGASNDTDDLEGMMTTTRGRFVYGGATLALLCARCSSGDVAVASNTAAIGADAANTGEAASISPANVNDDAEADSMATATPQMCWVATAQGVNAGGFTCYPPAAMPAGACSAQSNTCSFCGMTPCLGSPTGPRQFYLCSCVGAGDWRCDLTSQDTELCGPGADAAAIDVAEGDASR